MQNRVTCNRGLITIHWCVSLLLQRKENEDSSPNQSNTITHQTYVS